MWEDVAAQSGRFNNTSTGSTPATADVAAAAAAAAVAVVAAVAAAAVAAAVVLSAPAAAVFSVLRAEAEPIVVPLLPYSSTLSFTATLRHSSRSRRPGGMNTNGCIRSGRSPVSVVLLRWCDCSR